MVALMGVRRRPYSMGDIVSRQKRRRNDETCGNCAQNSLFRFLRQERDAEEERKRRRRKIARYRKRAKKARAEIIPPALLSIQ